MTTSTPENFSVLTGQAYFCAFITPDSYKGGPKTYKGRLLIEESSATDLIKYLDDLTDSHVDELKKENPKKRININPMYTYMDQFPGMIAVSFKQLAEVPTKDGGIWEPKIAIYDAKAKKDNNIKSIPNGSTIKVSWQPRPWYVPGNSMCGIKMQPIGVQIINLETELEGGDANPFTEVSGQGVYEAQTHKEDEKGEDLFSDTTEEEPTGSDF